MPWMTRILKTFSLAGPLFPRFCNDTKLIDSDSWFHLFLISYWSWYFIITTSLQHCCCPAPASVPALPPPPPCPARLGCWLVHRLLVLAHIFVAEISPKYKQMMGQFEFWQSGFSALDSDLTVMSNVLCWYVIGIGLVLVPPPGTNVPRFTGAPVFSRGGAAFDNWIKELLLC